MRLVPSIFAFVILAALVSAVYIGGLSHPCPSRGVGANVPLGPVGRPATDGPRPRSVAAIPEGIESVLTFNFSKEPSSPWLSGMRPKPDRAESFRIPGLPEELLGKILAAGMTRLSLGARGFRAGLTKRGDREELRIIETERALSEVAAGLESLSKDRGTAVERLAGGRIFSVKGKDKTPTWIGIAGENTLIISTTADLARKALSRLSEGKVRARSSLEEVSAGVDWAAPVVLIRLYDTKNPHDLFSPLNPARDKSLPQARQFRVRGISLEVKGGPAPSATLDVLTEEPDEARAYYTDLLDLESVLEEGKSPGKGWIQMRFDSKEGKESRFWHRVFLLFGYQPR
ncbi:MAG: hypothetical protein O7H41_06165 [Planctomycetota bacterium]|nr:hypothetical protein [Planctomycetota bacterium]